MSDAPFRVEFDQSAFVGNYAVRVNGTLYCGFHTLTEADMCRDEANAAWEAAGGPDLTRQRDELRDAVAIALDEINLAAKTDPMLNGERLLKGVDHVRWNARVIPALDRLAAALRRGEVPHAK